MNILVTGANGFVGKNLCRALENIKENKDRTHPGLQIDEIYKYDLSTPAEKLEEFCQKADFVFNLAGVNRPKNNDEFMRGNFGFASTLLETLKKYGNKAPGYDIFFHTGHIDRQVCKFRLRQVKIAGRRTCV